MTVNEDRDRICTAMLNLQTHIEYSNAHHNHDSISMNYLCLQRKYNHYTIILANNLLHPRKHFVHKIYESLSCKNIKIQCPKNSRSILLDHINVAVL